MWQLGAGKCTHQSLRLLCTILARKSKLQLINSSMQPGILQPAKNYVTPHSVNGFLPVPFTTQDQKNLIRRKERCRSVRMNGISICAVAAAAPSTRLKIYTASEMTDAELTNSTARPRIDFNDILKTVIMRLVCMHG